MVKLAKSGGGEQAYPVEKLNEHAHQRMEFVPKPALGFPANETVGAPEVAFLHNPPEKPLCLGAAGYVEERHLAFGQAKTIHHQTPESLPRLHQVHCIHPPMQFFQIKLSVIGMQGDGHV